MIFEGGGGGANSSGSGGPASDVNLNKIGGTTQSGANVVDVLNTALRVNAVAGTVTANAGSGTFAVSGTVAVANFPATQPVSGTVTANAGTNLNTSALALESGGNLATIAGKDFATQSTLALIKAKTDNLDVLLSTRLKPADTLTGVTTVTSITNPVAVTGTFWQATQPVSGSVSVSNFPATQPVSGSVTANAGTNLNTSALALESGGNLATLTGKDFATQATLALIKAKTDNLDAASSTLAKESGGNLATIAAKDFATSAKQDTGNTTLAQIDIDLADLRIAQGATNSTQRGPLVMGIANDTPVSYIDGQIQPLSLTSEGRLRVVATASDMDRVWVTTFDNPWESTWFPAVGEELSYV